VDSTVQGSNEFAPFLNIMNEWYLRDCSRKIQSTLKQKGMSGKHLTNNVIYGYKKDPADKNHWLIDEEAAAVVRRIFRLVIEGKGVQQIARMFMEEKIPRPSYYLAQRGLGTMKNKADISLAYAWNCQTITKIISRPEYMGYTVNFRTYKNNYKEKTRKKRPPEEWQIFENTQEAIVDEQTWHLAQQLRKTIRRTDTTGEANPFTGLMYCADCGAKMYNHRGSSGPYRDWLGRETGKQLPNYDIFRCSTHCRSQKVFQNNCSEHYIRTAAVREIVLEAIRSVSQYAIGNQAEFAKKLRENSSIQQQAAAKALQKQIAREEKRCKELDGLIKKLYEAYATGKLAEKRFEMLSAEYEQEQADLEISIAKAQADLKAFNADTNNVEQFMALARKYTDFSELTTPMINEFIDKILVHEADRSSGERVQEVEIYFKFIGRFEVPKPEPTSEEIAAEAARLKRLIKQREYTKRYRERRKQRYLQELAEQEKRNKQAGN